MNPLYLYILLGSLSVPLFFSIWRMDLIRHWKNFIISTSLIAIVFLIWDAIFTYHGVWAFNKNYCIGIDLFGMPIEEWLFFFIIPFSSLFIHFALCYAMPRLRISKKATRLITVALIIIVLIVLIYNLFKLYTTVNFLLLLLVLVIGLMYKIELLQRFLISFLIILIPFFLVNGLLTGVATQEPVVIYNNLENIGIRITTIPIEDFGYAFTMLFGNLMLFDFMNKKTNK